MSSRFAQATDICGRRAIGTYDDGGDGYYWVPGTWVLAPEPGYLWTPGYWGWGGNAFLGTAGIGDRMLVSMAALTMDLDISGMDLKAGAGKTIISSTTPRSCM